MSEPALDLEAIPELDFTRYAPAKRHELVWVRPQLPQAPAKPSQPPGELGIIGQHIGAAFGLIGQCIRIAIVILWRRALLRLTMLYHRIAQSLNIAWALAGFGWGGFIGYSIIFPAIVHFVR